MAERLEDEQQQDLAKILEICPTASSIYQLAQRFREMVTQRQPTALKAWLVDAKKSKLREFKRFANGILQDEAAVRAALTLELSNGPVEGHVNRLKVIRRQMYGRGKLDLLRCRVIGNV